MTSLDTGGQSAGAAGPHAQSVTGNLVDLAAGQVLLPAFAVQRADGLFVDLSRLAADAEFERFVEHVFAAAGRFDGLDYEVMLRLLHAGDGPAIGALAARQEKSGKRPELRLATAVVPFPEERQGLYKGVRIEASGMAAEYMFEPVVIERIIDEPVYGEAVDGGEAPVVRWERRTLSEKAQLDPDEFVAGVWDKGLRYGLDIAVVRDAIASGRTGRVIVARGLPAKPGSDATLVEQTKALHRDNAPRILADGRVDLRQFQNRFPQIKAGTRLLKKVPRTPGEDGRDVRGQRLEPPPTKDFDLETLAGPGTRVERLAEGEFIVAAADGFLSIDAASNQVSLTAKIVSHEGISARTTGDLALCGESYEEHGEVQERRVVEGLNMAFFADVFGNLVSHGGEIVVHAALAGGSAESDGGRIQVDGNASRSRLVARGGEISAAFAESCLIVGGRVRVERAVNCTICADDLEIGCAEGCAIAARNLRLGVSKARKDTENAVSLRVPDFSATDRDIGLRRQHLVELAERQANAERALAALAEGKELKTFLALVQKIQSGKLVLTAEQKPGWEQMKARAAPALRQLAALREQVKAAVAEQAEGQAAIEAALAERERSASGIACTIAEVAGDTEVRTLPVAADEPPLDTLAQRELELRLRSLGRTGRRLFSGSSGSFDWRFAAAEPA